MASKSSLHDTIPPHLQHLFHAKAPPRYLPPADYDLPERMTQRVGGTAPFMEDARQMILNPRDEENLEKTVSAMEKKQAHRADMIAQQRAHRTTDVEAWKQSKDPKAYDAVVSVIVAHLPYKLTEDALYDLFARGGTRPKEVRIIRDARPQEEIDADKGKKGAARKAKRAHNGYGFVTFSDEATAKRAIQQFNGKAVMNRQILVDAVKGKLDPDFRPHHLSGTLGGRHYTKTPSYNRDFGFGRGGFRGGLRGGPRGGGSYAGRGRDIVPSGAPAGPRGGRSHGGGMNGSGPSFDDRRGGSSGSNMEPLGGRDRGFGSHGMADRGRGDERGGDRYHSSYDRGNDRGHDRERRYFDRDDDPYSRRRGDDGRGTKRVHERDDPGPAHKRIDDRDRRR